MCCVLSYMCKHIAKHMFKVRVHCVYRCVYKNICVEDFKYLLLVCKQLGKTALALLLLLLLSVWSYVFRLFYNSGSQTFNLPLRHSMSMSYRGPYVARTAYNNHDFWIIIAK